MPCVERLTIDLAVAAAEEAAKLGIAAVALFPHTQDKLKTADGREAVNPKNLVCLAVKAIKKTVPELGVMCDVALDPYTNHGHDGVLVGDSLDGRLKVELHPGARRPLAHQRANRPHDPRAFRQR